MTHIHCAYPFSYDLSNKIGNVTVEKEQQEWQNYRFCFIVSKMADLQKYERSKINVLCIRHVFHHDRYLKVKQILRWMGLLEHVKDCR